MSFGWPEIESLLAVVAVDLSLAGDNAVVVGMAAGGLPEPLRKRAILMGIGAAAGLRAVLALVAVSLLHIVGLTAAGGLLLLWVAWKFWQEIRRREANKAAPAGQETDGMRDRAKTLRQAVTRIFIADLSMSFDNVLAVAGAANNHRWILVAGLGLSVLFMAIAANLIARLVQRHGWIAPWGLAIIVYVALKMIWDGGREVLAPIL